MSVGLFWGGGAKETARLFVLGFLFKKKAPSANQSRADQGRGGRTDLISEAQPVNTCIHRSLKVNSHFPASPPHAGLGLLGPSDLGGHKTSRVSKSPLNLSHQPVTVGRGRTRQVHSTSCNFWTFRVRNQVWS